MRTWASHIECLLERAGDREPRRQAAAAASALLSYAKRVAENPSKLRTRLVYPGERKGFFEIPGDEVNPRNPVLSGLALRFLPFQRHKSYYRDRPYPMVAIANHTAKPILLKPGWSWSRKADLAQTLLALVSPGRLVFPVLVHEFIHALDAKRYNVGLRTPDPGSAAYYHDPAELNAFYQAAADAAVSKWEEALEDTYSSDDDDRTVAIWKLDDLLKRDGRDEFLRDFRRGLPWGHFSDRDRRRLLTRAGALLAELQQQVRDRFADLRREKDPAIALL